MELSLILISFIIAVIFLAILWRMALALDKIALHLEEISDDRKASREAKGRSEP